MLAAAVALLLLAALPSSASDHGDTELPFTAVLSGSDVTFNTDSAEIDARCDSEFAFSVTTFRGSGQATHLGRVGFVAEHCSLDFGQGPGPYEQGQLTLYAANGDQLKATYTNGVSDPTNFPVIAFRDDFSFVDGGTGRFTFASGGGVETGLFHFFTDEFTVQMNGTITYDASSRSAGQ